MQKRRIGQNRPRSAHGGGMRFQEPECKKGALGKTGRCSAHGPGHEKTPLATAGAAASLTTGRPGPRKGAIQGAKEAGQAGKRKARSAGVASQGAQGEGAGSSPAPSAKPASEKEAAASLTTGRPGPRKGAIRGAKEVGQAGQRKACFAGVASQGAQGEGAGSSLAPSAKRGQGASAGSPTDKAAADAAESPFGSDAWRASQGPIPQAQLSALSQAGLLPGMVPGGFGGYYIPGIPYMGMPYMPGMGFGMMPWLRGVGRSRAAMPPRCPTPRSTPSSKPLCSGKRRSSSSCGRASSPWQKKAAARTDER